MKKLCLKTVNKIILLTLFVLTQVNAWAVDTTPNENTVGEFFAKPWVWAVIVLIIGFVVAAIFTGRSKPQNRYQAE